MTDKSDYRENLLARMDDAIEKPNSIVPVETRTEQQITADKDAEYTKKKLKDLVELGEDVLENAKDIAIESGEPRSIEVFAALLKNVGELARQVIETDKTRSAIDKDITGPKEDKPSSVSQTNIFVGTTADLMKKLQSISGDDDIIEHEK